MNFCRITTEIRTFLSFCIADEKQHRSRSRFRFGSNRYPCNRMKCKSMFVRVPIALPQSPKAGTKTCTLSLSWSFATLVRHNNMPWLPLLHQLSKTWILIHDSHDPHSQFTQRLQTHLVTRKEKLWCSEPTELWSKLNFSYLPTTTQRGKL